MFEEKLCDESLCDLVHGCYGLWIDGSEEERQVFGVRNPYRKVNKEAIKH